MNTILKRSLIIGVPSVLGVALFVYFTEKEHKKTVEQAKFYNDLVQENCDILMKCFKNAEETDQIQKSTIETLKEIENLLNS